MKKYSLSLDKNFQNGQVVVVVLLTMLVALSIGLVITQRTITDLETSTESEQSSRAFSAAEAGIEKAISDEQTVTTPSQLGNDSVIASRAAVLNLPQDSNQALEYPKIGKETIAHFWLANPEDLSPYYNGYTVNFYFGNYPNPGAILPAVELSILTFDTGTSKYTLKKHFIDSNTTDRGGPGNGFAKADLQVDGSVFSGAAKTFSPYKLIHGTTNFYARKLNLPISDLACGGNRFPTCYAVLARARILYSEDSQSIALGPSSGANGFPGQASIYTSVGRAGKTERRLVSFRQKYVVPNYFDFGIFSLGNITKNN